MLSDILTKNHVILNLLWMAFYVWCFKWLEIYRERVVTKKKKGLLRLFISAITQENHN